jgi:hypothetical protein
MDVLSWGSSVLSWAPVAVPRLASACSTRDARSSSQASTSSSIRGSVPLRLSWLIRRVRSAAANGVLTAA